MAAPTISSLSTTGTPPTGAVGGAGGSPAGPTGSVTDLFGQLREFSWKGVSFPTTRHTFTLRQDLVIHRFADRNGAYVEGTGRPPVQVRATIPFLNYIYAAPQETWSPGALYPYQFRLFLQRCLDGTSGILQHPELGDINCKVDLSETTWDGKVQGGVWVEATWLESDDTQADQIGQDLSAASPVSQFEATADDIDANIATLAAAVSAQQNPLPPLEFTFSDLVSLVVGVIDIPTILDKQAQGMAQNILYEASRVQDALAMSPVIGPLSWPIFQAAERLKDSAYQVLAQPTAVAGRSILTATVQKPCTLSQAMLIVGAANIEEFIALNAPLVASPVIPAGTQVQYYQNAA